MAKKSSIVGGLLAACLWLSGCGGKHEDNGPSAPPLGSTQAAFLKAARDSSLPARFLMATAFLESRLSPQNASASYISVATGDAPVARGTLMTETAFGLTRETLGLDPAKPESAELEGQIAAYGQWLAATITAQGVKLSPDPKTQEEKFHWVQALALLHRQGLAQRRNVQIIFARELIQILNEGFAWQNPRTGELIELKPEVPAVSIDDAAFPENGKAWFQLSEIDEQEIDIATFMPLATVPADEFENKPRRIEVIHCPLTLSACLELQTRSQESDVSLAAHYVIPQIMPVAEKGRATDRSVLNKVLQLAKHRRALTITSSTGENRLVNDAVVIMLTGNSGRTVAGSRQPAIPNWFTDQQLRALGQVINDVCTLISQKDPSVKSEDCMNPANDQGVHFRHQDRSEEYRWGDIADFDPTIFAAYIRSPSGLGTEVSFQFTNPLRQFRAGERIPVTTLYDSSARTVEIERLARCSSGKVLWEPVRIQQVRGETRGSFEVSYFDSGPNRNGDQYLRARVYGKDGKLIGWTMAQILLSKYETDLVYASDKQCES